jgi:surfactin synthase thioesterase subunit/glycosyltransferase involved in cell wall biosynthesis
MRILLASSASYLPPRGGSTRSNLAWLRRMAAHGHQVRVVSDLVEGDPGLGEREGEDAGVSIRGVRVVARRAGVLGDEISRFAPDLVLMSSEDLSHALLREVASHPAAAGRLVYLAHTPQFFPFGPESWNPEERSAAILRGARAVITIGAHMAGYVQRHLGRTAEVVHPPIYGSAPWRVCGAFDNQWVLMVNPCAVKGLPILLDLARRLPQFQFAALRGWGTTASDAAQIAKPGNIHILEAVPDIETLLARTRILLMPSLWYEGFGLIAMEAMLRGVPVIASDSGGLAEAKSGTGYVIPVRPIRRWDAEFDQAHMPRPVVEAQDIEPWEQALTTLAADRRAWESEAARSRDAALKFVSSLDPDAMEKLLESLVSAAGPPPPLRILLAHNSLYFPSYGGGDKSNRLLMEALAARGHNVRVVARVETFGDQAHRRHLDDLAARGVSAEAAGPDPAVVRLALNGVEVHTLTRDPNIRAYLAAQIAAFDPDVVVASTDDPAQLLLEVSLRAARRVVYLVRATIAAPFGPDSSAPNEARAEMLRCVDGCVGVSEYVARYMREHGRIDAVHVPISLMEGGTKAPPAVGAFDNPFVTMVNPCAVKGIDVFVGIAARMPHLRFAAVPTWGTTDRDLAVLRALPNVTLLQPADNIDDILRQTRVLLVPSVWAEARSRVVPEAMARGVPVMASDQGGLPEAKLGVDYVLPVTPLAGYRSRVDENMVPVAEVPRQNVAPWVAALQRLTGDRQHWELVAAASRRAALAYIEQLSVVPFETSLRQIVASARPHGAGAAGGLAATTVALSADRRRLLALLLKKAAARRTASDLWFPIAGPVAPGRVRLFCFPFAGGGTLPYRTWQMALADVAAVCPVLLPGRETRLEELPLQSMEAVVAALMEHLDPLLGKGAPPFAFFGHSMGAGTAFELTRALRRAGRPLPCALFVSAARAPQYRARLADAVRDEELADAARREDAEWRRIGLAALRADTALYRRHSFAQDDPLAMPVFAYGGADDPRVLPEHLEGWRAHTVGPFRLRLFAGGHAYLDTNRAAVLAALESDLAGPAR